MTDLQSSDDRNVKNDRDDRDDRQPTGTVGRAAAPGRDETAAERADRRWVELLQEVRVAQTGVQILLAFLLSVAFTPRFTELGSTDRTIYVVTIVLGAAATGALIAPVSFHRFVSGQQMKPQAVEWASRLTVTGLLLLLCTIMCALLLILRVVLHHSAALWIVSGVFLWFLACWVVLPAWARWSK